MTLYSRDSLLEHPDFYHKTEHALPTLVLGRAGGQISISALPDGMTYMVWDTVHQRSVKYKVHGLDLVVVAGHDCSDYRRGVKLLRESLR